jgi:hypothetical protein
VGPAHLAAIEPAVDHPTPGKTKKRVLTPFVPRGSLRKES